MKNKEFYHTSIELKESPFDIISLKEITTELIQNIKKFNSSKDINEKIQLSQQIPIEFPKCRFCGNIIINSNFYIDLKQKKKTIQLINPKIYCREIDGKKYYLSCCEKCLLDHFKDNPPKAPKYYFMKANIYGQYSYGYSNEEYKKICSMTVGVTYNSMINKWGEELGEQKWKEYCDKHSKIASKEYFIDKYGKENGLKIYHNSRAITKNGMIKKYGKKIGLEKWKNYCDKQRYTCSLEYFIKEYGENIGKEKYKNFTIQRAYAGQSGRKITVSQISQELFDKLYKYIDHSNDIYYDKLNYEYIIHNDITHKNYLLDFYDKTKNLIIEFQGDFWHANPNKYSSDDILKFPKSIIENHVQLTAKEIWEYDQNKKNFICQELNNPIYLQIWESDYKNNKQKIIQDILLYYNIKLNENENEISD